VSLASYKNSCTFLKIRRILIKISFFFLWDRLARGLWWTFSSSKTMYSLITIIILLPTQALTIIELAGSHLMIFNSIMATLWTQATSSLTLLGSRKTHNNNRFFKLMALVKSSILSKTSAQTTTSKPTLKLWKFSLKINVSSSYKE